nr:MAG TPA: hypothetical protein [Bacteriophage sp.]
MRAHKMVIIFRAIIFTYNWITKYYMSYDPYSIF